MLAFHVCLSHSLQYAHNDVLRSLVVKSRKRHKTAPFVYSQALGIGAALSKVLVVGGRRS